jgi:hypothetical protein
VAFLLAGVCLQTPPPPPPSSQIAAPLAAAASFKSKLAQIDLLSTAVLISGMVCLLLALKWGGSVHAWNSATLITLLTTLCVTTLVFITIQILKQEKATVPPRIRKQRSVLSSAIYVFCAGGALNVFQYFLPI